MPTKFRIRIMLASILGCLLLFSPEAQAAAPSASSSIMQIGFQQIQERVGSLPGRSVQDLVNSQPGWLTFLTNSQTEPVPGSR